MKYTAKDEERLITALHDPDIKDDLVRFVMFCYPWGQEGTPLAEFSGPRAWQRAIMDDISAHIAANKGRADIGLTTEIFRLATASGRGIGKSALVSWISHWMITTRIGSTTYISANTKPQLESNTFPEIRKWFNLAINAHWFELLATEIRPAKWLADLMARPKERGGLSVDPEYCYVQGRLWSEENPDAYAGPHSQIGMLLIFDEASGIPRNIWNVARGFFSDAKNRSRFWLAFSNPRNNSGGFYDCFYDENEKPFWRTRQIDARTVEDIDSKEHEKVIAGYGLDHDMVRVEVLGQFPKQGADQFISNALVDEAIRRETRPDHGAPLMMGVDVARFGDDKTVVRFRQGPDARSIPPVEWGHADLTVTADRVAQLIDEHRPDAVCIDHGMGAGVIDILRRRKYVVHEIHFGSGPDNDEWADKRTEMYGRLRAWLPGGMLDNHKGLFADLTAAGYDFTGKAKDRLKLESKENFKSKLGRSPDHGDALALTFAVNVSRRDRATSRFSRSRSALNVDYSLFG